MIKEVKYGGYTATPSDYESLDGDLATAINLINEDGALHPVMPPTAKFRILAGYDVKHIHKGTDYEHYIIQHYDTTENKTKLYWIDSENASGTITVGEIDPIHEFSVSITEVNSIGNTLLVLTSNGMHYILWADNAYKYLGNHIPEISLSFGLLGRPRFYSIAHENFTINFDSMTEDDIINGHTFSENNQKLITEQVMAKLNKFVAETTVNHGRHCFPFFIRYALRLYDGSLVLHSAPILMNPGTTGGPIVMWKSAKGSGGSYTSATMDIMLMATTILWRVVNDTEYSGIGDWTDIVKSVDIFISKPLYTYDPNGICKSFGDTDNFETRFIGKLYAHRNDQGEIAYGYGKSRLISPMEGADDMLTWFSEYPYWQIYAMYSEPLRTKPITTLNLPEYDEDKTREQLENVSNFYLLHSIPIEELPTQDIATTETEIITPDDYLSSLVTREVMTDDYQTHDLISPKSVFTYNNRLNIGNIKRTLYGGYKPESMFARCKNVHSYKLSAHQNGTKVTVEEQLSFNDWINIYTHIKIDGKEYVVRNSDTATRTSLVEFFSHTYSSGENSRVVTPSSLAWLFYPDRNAYKMVIKQGTYSGCYEIELKPHPFLNGAYAFINYGTVRNRQNIGLPTLYNPGVNLPNKLYSSEIDNPFVFPATGIATTGTGTILGLRSATKALSQGQFGQFPLYAFTTEGVWALEVSSTGTFTARQPITRDVVLGYGKSITQIDTAVLFATDRGIMLISGSQSQCISDTLDAGALYNPSPTLPYFDQIYSWPFIQTVPFKTFLDGVQMLYDYSNQRIIVYNPSYPYAYTYSLKSKMWGLMPSTIKSSLNSYPDALASQRKVVQNKAAGQQISTTYNQIVNYSLPDTNVESVNGIIITRPLKLDDPDTLKTIEAIIQRGYFRSGHVKTALYGSRDLFNWFYVDSSTNHRLKGLAGTPYKYFRIVAVCEMQKDESLYGATIQLSTRYTSKIR